MTIINRLFIFTFVCAFGLLLVNSAISSSFGEPNAFGISQVCEGSIACSLIDANWPSGKEFNCGNTSVYSTSFTSATPYIMMGQGKSMINSSAWWPSSVTVECQNTTDGEHYQYYNGVWTAYYSIVTNCGCIGTGESALPDCTAATSQSTAACNIAMFTFCGMKRGDVDCTYT
ncbi:secreted protein [Melampsora americana]|nr:secreted protein [Melampsora americana]